MVWVWVWFWDVLLHSHHSEVRKKKMSWVGAFFLGLGNFLGKLVSADLSARMEKKLAACFSKFSKVGFLSHERL